MKIGWYGRTRIGNYAMQVEPGKYDGVPPIRSLFVDHWPNEISDDVLSVAGVLAFGEYCCGEVELPRPVSPEVAEAIEEFLSPSWSRISPVAMDPRPNPVGEGVVVVRKSIHGWEYKPSVIDSGRHSILCVVPGSDFSGSLVSPQGILVSSNAYVLAELSREGRVLAPLIAVALLYCESFRAKAIRISDDLEIDPNFDRYRELLASARIALLD